MKKLFLSGSNSATLLVVLSILWVLLISVSAEVTAPAKTPKIHKNAAINFSRQRAKVLEAVDKALKSRRVNGESSNDNLIAKITSLRRVIESSTNAIKADKNPEYTDDEQAALKELLKIYNNNYLPITVAKNQAWNMLKTHDDLFVQIRALKEATGRSSARRARCANYADTLTDLMEAAVQGRFFDTVSGPDLQKVMIFISETSKALGAKEALAELLDQGVRSELAQIEEVLLWTNPKEAIKKVKKSSSGKIGSPSEAWETYHNRWVGSLSGHLREHADAYTGFLDAVSKPWINFYKDYPRVRLAAYRQTWAQLEDRERVLEEKLDKEEKEKRDQEKLKQEKAMAVDAKIRRIENSVTNINYRKNLLKQKRDRKKNEGAASSEISILDRGIESFDGQISRLEEDLFQQAELLENYNK